MSADELQPLGRRLRHETRGEVLFDAASRGRYATDASIYQIMPLGVFVPTSADDVATAAGTVSYELFCALAPRVPVSVVD